MVFDGLRDLIGVEGTCLTFGNLSGWPILADHSGHGLSQVGMGRAGH